MKGFLKQKGSGRNRLGCQTAGAALGFQIDGANFFSHDKVGKIAPNLASYSNIPKIDGAIAPLAPP